MEDDRLFGARARLHDFIDTSGRTKLYAKLDATPGGRLAHDATRSPWDNALAYSNALLDAAHWRARRTSIKHAPVLIDRETFGRFVTPFEHAVMTTRKSRFRGPGNIASEHMYPHWLAHQGLAQRVPLRDAYPEPSRFEQTHSAERA